MSDVRHLTNLVNGDFLDFNIDNSTDREWIELFLLLDTHFPPEKNWFLWDTTQNIETSQKKTR